MWVEYVRPGPEREAVAPLFAAETPVEYWIPDHSLIEIANALRKRYLRERGYTRDDFGAALADVLRLDPVFVSSAVLAPRLVAHLDTMTAYDAAYVVLARARQLPLCTLDVGQAAGAREVGVTVLEPGTEAFARWLEGD